MVAVSFILKQFIASLYITVLFCSVPTTNLSYSRQTLCVKTLTLDKSVNNKINAHLSQIPVVLLHAFPSHYFDQPSVGTLCSSLNGKIANYPRKQAQEV
jgi:hypothetical protein